MPARRRNRYEFEHPDEDMPLPSGLPLPVVNANVFHPPSPAAHIQHIDNENNKMLEEALKASLEGYGLEEAKEESQQTAGDELFKGAQTVWCCDIFLSGNPVHDR